MCGICGIASVDPSARTNRERLERIRDLLSHRGPDDAGIWGGEGVALGHRRLSIIDLAGGHQPMANEDETIWTTYNGEIYNFAELRDELRRRQHSFRTNSDTEVLVHGYEEWGLDLPKRLNGIFAFAIYDTNRRQLVIVRDQLGVKPLFYAIRNDELAFASEIRSVLAALDIEPRTSVSALQEYLIFRYLASERTFFEGVSRLPPGHLAVWRNGRLEIRSYWSPAAASQRKRMGRREAIDRLDVLLAQAVERQLMSDVPLGAFCSGGVDSGLTTSYAVREHDASNFRTYSVAFEDDAWDESALALDTAERLGTSHQTITTRAPDILRGFEELIQFGDEPLSHPNMIPLLELSRFARRDVKVVLTGEGADEMFCGYPRYHVLRIRHLVGVLPGPGRRLLGAIMSAMPGHRMTKLGRAMGWSMEDALLYNSAYVDPDVVEQLTGTPIGGALDHRRRLVRQTRIPGDPAASLSRYELMTYIVCALERLDRVSMAAGLEARVPFLDMELVEWGLRAPSSVKLRGRENKWLVKELATGKLSGRVLNAPKSGFGLPLGQWFRSQEFAPLIERMKRVDHPAAEVVDPSAVRSTIAEHQSGRRNHEELLWLLANLYLWYDVHTEGSDSIVKSLELGTARLG